MHSSWYKNYVTLMGTGAFPWDDFLDLLSTEAHPQHEVVPELPDPPLIIALRPHDPRMHWLLPAATVPYHAVDIWSPLPCLRRRLHESVTQVTESTGICTSLGRQAVE